eukprot:10769918-Alexandrium_andersonii.AAC.1
MAFPFPESTVQRGQHRHGDSRSARTLHSRTSQPAICMSRLFYRPPPSLCTSGRRVALLAK